MSNSNKAAPSSQPTANGVRGYEFSSSWSVRRFDFVRRPDGHPDCFTRGRRSHGRWAALDHRAGGCGRNRERRVPAARCFQSDPLSDQRWTSASSAGPIRQIRVLRYPRSITVKPAGKETATAKTTLNQAVKPAKNQVIIPAINQTACRPRQNRWPCLSLMSITAPSPVGGWQPFGTLINNQPVMARTVVNPDPGRPYAQAAVVRIDLSQVDLHAVPGTIEPVAAKGTPPFKRPGDIPVADQSVDSLLAAFNGGFKAIHGGYGMMVDGVTILPPLDNLATLALFKDGSVKHRRVGPRHYHD